MFRIQKKVIYAIEAVIDIALNSGPGLVQNEDVAKRQGIPKRYLEFLLEIRFLLDREVPKEAIVLQKKGEKLIS